MATCGPSHLRLALPSPVIWITEEQPRRAAAAIAALVSNPHLTFDQFERLIAESLAHWLTWHHQFKSSERVDAEFQVPATAPGDRAADWWHRLAVNRERLEEAAGGELRYWHHTWVFRRAFATNTPEQWPALWRAAAGWDESAQAVRGELTALALHRGLPGERLSVPSSTEAEIEALANDWARFAQSLGQPVPPSTTREGALRALAAVVGFIDPVRAAVAAPLRRAVLESAVAGDVEVDYSGAPHWLALFTAADQASLLTPPGACRKEPIDTWINDARWWSNPAAEVFRTALRIYPLDGAVARRHLTCAAPRHRMAMVLNPGCPEEVALEALRRGIHEADTLLTTGKGLPPDGGGCLVETWWRTLMTVRGWLPPHEVSAALQKVTGWMLASAGRLPWVWHLAVTASQPEGIVGMDAEQYAAFESWLDELAERQWTRSERSDLTRWNAREFAAATSLQMLRRVIHSTGGVKSPLLADALIMPSLSDLPPDLRVQTARKASDEILRTLLDDPDRRVRQHVARNRNASTDTLNRLADDPDPAVRAQVARNATITAQCLTTLAADPVPRVAQAAGQALLRRLAAAS